MRFAYKGSSFSPQSLQLKGSEMEVVKDHSLARHSKASASQNIQYRTKRIESKTAFYVQGTTRLIVFFFLLAANHDDSPGVG